LLLGCAGVFPPREGRDVQSPELVERDDAIRASASAVHRASAENGADCFLT
jgi:hypothetical protein